MTPRPQKYDLTLVSVETDGKATAWCEGHFRGAPEILKEARINIEIDYEYRLFNVWVTCSADNPVGIAAALCSYRPGRELIQGGPKEVWALAPAGCVAEAAEPNVP